MIPSASGSDSYLDGIKDTLKMKNIQQDCFIREKNVNKRIDK